EEEGDGAGRQVGHGLLQTLGWAWFDSIVARRNRGQATDSLPYHPFDPGVRNR
ncbi:MAG: hypothetical protein K0R44_3077, partial [Thermomicrobiales bacterium]|nr:hypothetical protein [Thermomicrobiales bacterium]